MKKRLYIGPTTLDPSLAFIMANMAHARENSLVFDPFVGTGSILIAASALGAFSIGADIDIRVLNGEMYAGTGDRNLKRHIFDCFRQYELPRPELIRLDNHLLDGHMRIHSSEQGFYDAIITDPPYGIRAGAKKTGKKGYDAQLSEKIIRDNHIPRKLISIGDVLHRRNFLAFHIATQTYSVEEVMLDLLHNAARALRMNGRLAYLIPTPYDFTLTDLPWHPCLEVIAMSEQSLSTRHGRRLVTMRKIANYSEALDDRFRQYKADVISGNDQGFGKLKSKLEAALASDAFDNDAVVKVISKACSRRRESFLKRRELAIKKKEEGFQTISQTIAEVKLESVDEP